MKEAHCRKLMELEENMIEKYIHAAENGLMPISEHMQYVKTICDLERLADHEKHEKEERAEKEDLYKLIEEYKSKKQMFKTTHSHKEEMVKAFKCVLREWEQMILDLYYASEFDYEKPLISDTIRHIWDRD